SLLSFITGDKVAKALFSLWLVDSLLQFQPLEEGGAKRKEMDSLEWSKKYEVLSISRLVLSDLGFTNEQITSLTDEDMQALADGLQESISKSVGNLLEEVRFLVC